MALQNKLGKLFIISGPSGTGKGSICKKLIENNPDLALSISMTTRKPREGEIEGVHYYFVSDEEFVRRINDGGLLENAEVYGKRYGTPKEPVIKKLEQGIDVVLEIDIQGALSVKKNYPEGIAIFVLPPSLSELKKRLIGRGTDTKEAIELRLGETLNELSFIEKYDYCVVNDVLENAVQKVESIMSAEHSKIHFTPKELIDKYKEE